LLDNSASFTSSRTKDCLVNANIEALNYRCAVHNAKLKLGYTRDTQYKGLYLHRDEVIQVMRQVKKFRFSTRLITDEAGIKTYSGNGCNPANESPSSAYRDK